MTKILVLDDDVDVLEMVTALLMVADMDVCGISNAGMLVEEIGRFKPDLVLMDIYLGSNDGRDLCHALKTTGPSREIPIILYSAGNITSASIVASLADDFMPKPFDIDDLLGKITQLVK